LEEIARKHRIKSDEKKPVSRGDSQSNNFILAKKAASSINVRNTFTLNDKSRSYTADEIVEAFPSISSTNISQLSQKPKFQQTRQTRSKFTSVKPPGNDGNCNNGHASTEDNSLPFLKTRAPQKGPKNTILEQHQHQQYDSKRLQNLFSSNQELQTRIQQIERKVKAKLGPSATQIPTYELELALNDNSNTLQHSTNNKQHKSEGFRRFLYE